MDRFPKCPVPIGTLLPLLLICVICSIGCVSSPSQSWTQRHAAGLRDRLLQLSNTVDRAEAQSIADIAVQRSSALVQQYRLVWPPWVHNNLVNYRLRERGLCFDWANDLFAALYGHASSLELHLAVARMDTPREHNALVITARGQPFAQGLVLDAWRGSGRIWWGDAATDKYPWQLLPPDRIAPELQKLIATGSGLTPAR